MKKRDYVIASTDLIMAFIGFYLSHFAVYRL